MVFYCCKARLAHQFGKVFAVGKLFYAVGQIGVGRRVFREKFADQRQYIAKVHDHPDHYDKKALDKIMKPDTHIIAAGSVVAAGLKGASVLKNGESAQWNDIRIDAVPAYNIEHKSPNGKPFHEKGVGNGYVLSFKNFRVYIAGDTENIPEMSKLGKIQVAFLPKNLPYTM